MSDKLQGLIDGEREALVPSVDAREATWAKVAHSLQGPAAAPADLGADLGGAASVGASATTWTKVLLVFALGGGGAVYATSRGPADAPAPAPAVAQSERSPKPPRPSNVSQSPLASVTEATVTPAPVDVDVVQPAVGVGLERSLKAAAVTRPRTPTASSGDVASALAEEARLLEAARQAFADGDHAASLRHLRAQAQRFPSGQLAEDRLALQARVLCARGDTSDGQRAARALTAAFPTSKHAARVRRACSQTD